ncbi:MAG: P1 family peptidase [Planctomycetota bacterium]
MALACVAATATGQRPARSFGGCGVFYGPDVRWRFDSLDLTTGDDWSRGLPTQIDVPGDLAWVPGAEPVIALCGSNAARSEGCLEIWVWTGASWTTHRFVQPGADFTGVEWSSDGSALFLLDAASQQILTAPYAPPADAPQAWAPLFTVEQVPELRNAGRLSLGPGSKEGSVALWDAEPDVVTTGWSVFLQDLPVDATPDASAAPPPQQRPRARDLGIMIGPFPPGRHNAITDVAGVRVGHATLIEGDRVRTGVTVVLPPGDNPFRAKVPAGLHVANGFGKLIGSTQLVELGEIESPIALTNTLNVGKVADALVGWLLERPGNEGVRSVNVVVGETNDGRLNDIRARPVEARHVLAALTAASDGPVAEGSVGAGTGTMCFGWKGGIGTSSRHVGRHVLGVLVQSNFGGRLTVAGRAITATPPRRDAAPVPVEDRDGSCMIVIATDAPLQARNLARLADRSFAGMARTGASFGNGSGDYAIAFSTADGTSQELAHARLSPFFAAVADATEEAILNSLLRATTIESALGRAQALPIDAVPR